MPVREVVTKPPFHFHFFIQTDTQKTNKSLPVQKKGKGGNEGMKGPSQSTLFSVACLMGMHKQYVTHQVSKLPNCTDGEEKEKQIGLLLGSPSFLRSFVRFACLGGQVCVSK